MTAGMLFSTLLPIAGIPILLGVLSASTPVNDLSPQDKKDMVRALLKSLETRDPKPFGFINPEKYIQHDPRVEDGLDGFRTFASGLPRDTRVNTVRLLVDGDYVIAHSEMTVSDP